MHSALGGLFQVCDESGPRHHFLMATDHEAELCDRTVALVVDAAQCPAPHAMILPREGWEGQQDWRTPAAPLVVQMFSWAVRSSCTLTARWSKVCGTGPPTTFWPRMCS